VAVALLMIGGEFDLSVGSIIGVSGMTVMLLTVEAGWSLGPRSPAALLLGAAIGMANGLLVVRTACPRSSSRSARSSCCAASPSP
jgi:simple sugar transport system permease protein